jgi:hypothetical protein
MRIWGLEGQKTLIWGITHAESGFFGLEKEIVRKKLTFLSKGSL